MNTTSSHEDSWQPLLQQPDSAQVAPDSMRQFDSGWKENYTGDEFNYDRIEGQAQNYLSRFIRWVVESLAEIFGVDVSAETLSIMEFIIYALLGVLALYLVVRNISQAPLGQLFSKQEPEMPGAVWQEDDLQEIDLDALLKEALDSGDYRLAVRYQFLRLLKKLNREGKIDYHPEKTNWDYLAELSDSPLKSQFSRASRIYEYAWYGEQRLSAAAYGGVVSLFESENDTVKSKQGAHE
ncbi:protein of unknown function [Robiginitalea myxolifaciens]|uniref:Protein-glutamine gamma-glutamyltransferase-like C-terminal domain-containing protein n=1 Tax=Robiginitalea myxolifaciens TaxID=400055 RepID=A0A1I6H4P7_9FLAO|nr:DUF4129 domain-containing protein [Robiginitalea myxolifaciens]SFR49420.1 protein of unknown function [Robiginitalea myxolifaciens]